VFQFKVITSSRKHKANRQMYESHLNLGLRNANITKADYGHAPRTPFAGGAALDSPRILSIREPLGWQVCRQMLKLQLFGLPEVAFCN